VVNEIKTMNERIISAIGITMGITHAEYIVTDRGVRLIEIAARGCGSRVASDLIPAITGVDITEAKIRQSLGEKVELGGQRFQKSGILEFLMLPQGVIKSIRGLDKAKKIEGVMDVEYHVKVGDTVGIIDSGRARPGYLLAVGESREQVLEITEEVKRTLKVEMEIEDA
jgi:biotin carboxylase